jgi:MraZ protein
VFRGVTSINLDDKNRLAIPTKYREELKECCDCKLVITSGFDPCLLLYPLPEWEETERKLIKLPSLHPQVKRLQRVLIGQASECEMDGQGRFLIPESLRRDLGKRVALVGQGNKFEIWDDETWSRNRDAWRDEGGLESLGDLIPELETISF